ncbi:MAG: winged helix DNA-binding domain-containing protein [Actinomycetota bacterium]|nr:winged helix DNA-binding domain-containing protein [Actinomycetota bacterium]
MSSAELAIGVRTGVAPAGVAQALWGDRAIVKTWAMRGTLHLLAADELPIWVAALRYKEQKTRRGPAWERYHGVSVEQLTTMTKVVAEVLAGDPRTREEVASAVVKATGEPAFGAALRSGWGVILKSSAARGDLIFGPDRGRNVTFVDPRRWLNGRWEEPDPEKALDFVIHRFLDAYGPATGEDFGHWWGVPPAEGKRLLRSFSSGLEEVDLGGSAAWVTRSGAEGLSRSPAPSKHVRLLPAFDTYVFAPRSHRGHTWPEGMHSRISRTAGWISPALIVDGGVAGVWSYERVGNSVRVEIETLRPTAAWINAAAESHVRFYEGLWNAPAEVEWVEQLGASS